MIRQTIEQVLNGRIVFDLRPAAFRFDTGVTAVSAKHCTGSIERQFYENSLPKTNAVPVKIFLGLHQGIRLPKIEIKG